MQSDHLSSHETMASCFLDTEDLFDSSYIPNNPGLVLDTTLWRSVGSAPPIEDGPTQNGCCDTQKTQADTSTVSGTEICTSSPDPDFIQLQSVSNEFEHHHDILNNSEVTFSATFDLNIHTDLLDNTNNANTDNLCQSQLSQSAQNISEESFLFITELGTLAQAGSTNNNSDQSTDTPNITTSPSAIVSSSTTELQDINFVTFDPLQSILQTDPRSPSSSNPCSSSLAVSTTTSVSESNMFQQSVYSSFHPLKEEDIQHWPGHHQQEGAEHRNFGDEQEQQDASRESVCPPSPTLVTNRAGIVGHHGTINPIQPFTFDPSSSAAVAASSNWSGQTGHGQHIIYPSLSSSPGPYGHPNGGHEQVDGSWAGGYGQYSPGDQPPLHHPFFASHSPHGQHPYLISQDQHQPAGYFARENGDTSLQDAPREPDKINAENTAGFFGKLTTRSMSFFESTTRSGQRFGGALSPREYSPSDLESMERHLYSPLNSCPGIPHPSSPDSSTDNTKNICGVCGKTYARPSTLKTHLRTHSGERPYKCFSCNKSFSQAANLTAHCRTHSGEKPFHCGICDRKFSQSSSVTTHMRTHSGERPYRCRLCKKAFSDSSTLTKHLRIHSGEKPYQCKLCHLRFSQSGNLNRHMRIHAQNGR